MGKAYGYKKNLDTKGETKRNLKKIIYLTKKRYKWRAKI